MNSLRFTHSVHHLHVFTLSLCLLHVCALVSVATSIHLVNNRKIQVSQHVSEEESSCAPARFYVPYEVHARLDFGCLTLCASRLYTEVWLPGKSWKHVSAQQRSDRSGLHSGNKHKLKVVNLSSDWQTWWINEFRLLTSHFIMITEISLSLWCFIVTLNVKQELFEMFIKTTWWHHQRVVVIFYQIQRRCVTTTLYQTWLVLTTGLLAAPWWL